MRHAAGRWAKDKVIVDGGIRLIKVILRPAQPMLQ